MATFPLSAKAVFDEAVEIASPDARRDYLERACAGAPALRQEVEALLSAYADAGSFLESPPALGDSMDLRPAAERPGTMIGRYKLLRQIGEGGMGVVWMAEQTQPVQRQVALKVIKPGMDSKQVVARFEAERQALAVMDHVNIARVLDGGATAAGLPYFVMELVHGVPITRYCDDNHLTPRERLELFVPVCQAIQHAHQKGIIHRDIKPSNVMVTLYDGRPVPKVIDFGVAKATEQKPSDRTLFTQCGTLVGTLEYMSPEQAEMSAQGVDTRSDIFSLGVLLYELLTGSTPLTRARMKEAAHAEILRMIKEDEPQKPSTRVSDSGEALASISANRHTEPARLTKLMRGDLDWILMKCLEKDRTRRYETANGLAADIARHLNDEPVTAGAPSAGYKLRKFVKRNRAQVIAGGIVAGALVLGVVGTTTGMVWALKTSAENLRLAEQKTALAVSEEAAKEDAMREKGRADATVREFNQLAGRVLYDRAIADEASLYPAWPGKIEAMEQWLLDTDKLLAMLPEIEQTVAALRERALPYDEAVQQHARETHSRFAEWSALQAQVASLRRAQAIRDGSPPSPVELTAAQQGMTLKEQHEAAWIRVAPPVAAGKEPDRTVHGEEALGLLLARTALRSYDAGDRTEKRCTLCDTLAWALLANGQDQAALAMADEAIEAAAGDKPHYLRHKQRLEQAIAEAGTVLKAVDEQLRTLTQEVTARRTWTFAKADESQRFLHETLVDLLRKLASLKAKEKVEVDRRLLWARQIAGLTLDHPNALHEWAAVRAAIASNEKYARQKIELRDQDITGLVPIGENPVTKLWEFYELRSAWDGKLDPREIVIPEHKADGSIEMTGELGIVFVLLPGGKFTMGAHKDDKDKPNHDPAAESDETPHEVTLAPFFLARYELTQGQWARLWSGDESLRQPSQYKAGQTRADKEITFANPVEQVDWTTCDTLLTRHGLGLPGEAQWEYGCRGGTTTSWWPGKEASDLAFCANVLDLTADRFMPSWGRQQGDFDDDHVVHAPVGSFTPNAFGLHDVHGNVWEWCWDWYGDYGSEQAGDGKRSGSGSSHRCHRGGSFDYPAALARSANRNSNTPSIRHARLGLRPARTLTP